MHYTISLSALRQHALITFIMIYQILTTVNVEEENGLRFVMRQICVSYIPGRSFHLLKSVSLLQGFLERYGYLKNIPYIASDNTPIQYTAIFHSYKNDNFRMKKIVIVFLFWLKTWIAGTRSHSLCFRVKIRK